MKCDLCPSNESSEYFLKKGFLFTSSITISICDSCMEIFFNNFKIFKTDMELRSRHCNGRESSIEIYKKVRKNIYIFKNHYDRGKELEFYDTRGGFDGFINNRMTGRSFASCILFDKQTKELSYWIKELINDFGNEDVISYVKKRAKKEKAELEAYLKREKKKEQKQLEKKKKQKAKIVSLLKKEGKKLPASDIDFKLRIGDVDLVKKLCEEMYRYKRIGRTGNYRYFV